MPDDLIPISREELERDIAIQIASMNARKDVGWCRVPESFAKTLTERLLRTGLKPFRGPGVPTATSTQYPGAKR